MVSLFCFFLTFGLQPGISSRVQLSGRPVITLTLVKNKILAGEPIPLALTIVNGSEVPIEFSEYHPRFFAFADEGAITFTDSGARITSLPNERELFRRKGAFVVGGGRWAVATLAPGQSWQETIYLQRYIKSPPVGLYSLDYRVEFPYHLKNVRKDAMGEALTVGSRMIGRGSINFSIASGSDTDLQAIITDYASLLHTESGRHAEEALCVIDNTLVVTQLVQMLSQCRSYRNTMAALSRFADQKAARTIVRGCLKDADPRIVANAINVLADWKEELESDEIERLASSRHQLVREAIATYVGLFKGHRKGLKFQ